MTAQELWNTREIPDRVAERAFNNADVHSDGCRISRYSENGKGFAQIGWGDGGDTFVVIAHRAAWVYRHGQVPEGMQFETLCNPNDKRRGRHCVEPSHRQLIPIK